VYFPKHYALKVRIKGFVCELSFEDNVNTTLYMSAYCVVSFILLINLSIVLTVRILICFYF